MKWISAWWGIALALVAFVAGCESDGPAAQASQPVVVKGVVTLDGRTLTGGTVTFYPVGNDDAQREPGIARIESDGGYWIGNTNLAKPAGLAPGEYKVTVLEMTAKPAGTTGGVARLSTPETYADLATTPFKVNVVAGENRVRLDMVGQAGGVAGQNRQSRR